MPLDFEAIPLLDKREIANFNIPRTPPDDEQPMAGQSNSTLLSENFQSLSPSRTVEGIRVEKNSLLEDDPR
jgi:hypothetical protein